MSTELSVSALTRRSLVVKNTLEASGLTWARVGSNAPLKPFGPWETSFVVPSERS